ncbi:NAD-glutamate dehydrogenase [Aestuariirhabdus litorea]|uniref:NAD-glutamate dehydrogenase n=1 Tax=Aestuariirhabdus litorea TaxID=2528527 RepID=A0A3P3VQG3_9GAMM|nr:NAD-glutamate dehydrogenase [Aestuariirhabdus litorea]RRJ84965.1 NAD-glutamate dehydrogenase [Aestuariirhabdus litorea]RWW98189.1 NAD-glutamate dehydrogenase [Endozoicomonadaceae bacterium GTF-13]
MSNLKQQKLDTIDQLKQRIHDKLPFEHRKPVSALADLYFRESISRDLISTPLDELEGALLCLWDCIHQRVPGEPQIRIYNPSFEEHGWHCPHTVIEVITDDMPFLVSSITMELMRRELSLHRITHPVVACKRDDHGQLLDVFPHDTNEKGVIREAVTRIEVDQQGLRKKQQELKIALTEVLRDVREAVNDWEPMRAKLQEVIKITQSSKLPVSKEEKAETLAFLKWVLDDHFTLLGSRYYTLHRDNDGEVFMEIDEKSSLGTFRSMGKNTQLKNKLAPHIREQMLKPTLLSITKSTTRSTIHRPSHLDYLGIKHFDKQGNMVGEWRFFGLYASAAYISPIQEIPLVRQKASYIMQQARCTPNSHKGKTLQHILSQYPRDELLQASAEKLEETLTGILENQSRRQLRLFLRKDIFSRFVTALVLVPRDRFHTELRQQLQSILMDEFKGYNSEFNVQFSEQLTAHVHITVHCENCSDSEVSIEELEMRMREAMLSWQDHLHLALIATDGESDGNHLNHVYGNAFPAAYRDDHSPNRAVSDIHRIESITPERPISTHLSRPLGSFNELHFKVVGQGDTMALSDVLPILEHMGVRVLSARPYKIRSAGDKQFWILDFQISVSSERDLDDPELKEQFQQCFARTYRGELENDGFNSLIISAGLSWRQCVIVRALSKYLTQAQVSFSQTYMEETLGRNHTITALLVELFETRFAPHQESTEETAAELRKQITDALNEVANLDEDRILRHFLSVINAMLRTNYYQLDEQRQPKSYLSFKLDPEQVPALPLPRPKYEIFVYSPWVEGVHMRGGKVARGGLRWSDRREDFRTEILGLVKAQMVKNAVIVPTGAKGGFVAKQLPANGSREEVQAEVIHCYRTFIRGLLDITDNLQNNSVVPPQLTQRYDEDDPYLVVAADKGTATFSDIANEIAQQYSFWLDDAFASGGSFGYDHKKMGITARGAWESVKRLFKEQGRDCQAEPFTCVGIGDMSGDVFGNGMLLSRQTKLLAAFNHMHIFIDPDPQPETSWEERKRLFDLPRSSWSDYNTKLISKGGGIYERSAKSITLSKAAREALNIDRQKLTPSELVQLLLQAPVDLLWNGGIGTYVKASHETHADAGDRANDAVRVDGSQLRCQVVGEGGNLGFTQAGRVEFARRGGMVTTDAIDNSGGVDCSDHEVNIKIMLGQVLANGDMTLKQRNELLASMTEDVARLVLRHNYQQARILSLANQFASSQLGDHMRLINQLEREGRLKRKLEFLPSDEQLHEREAQSEGLSRPELSVLLAYSKMKLYEELLACDVCNDAALGHRLVAYFPKALSERYQALLETHPLRAEIIATHLTNEIGNSMGPTFWSQIGEESNRDTADIVRAYSAARAIFSIDTLWSQLEAISSGLSHSLQTGLFFRLQQLTERATLWILRNNSTISDLESLQGEYHPAVEMLNARLGDYLQGEDLQKIESQVGELTEAGLDPDLARRYAILDHLYYSLDIAAVGASKPGQLERAAEIFFDLNNRLQLHWLRAGVQELPVANQWQRKARATLADELDRLLRTTSTAVLSSADSSMSTSAVLDQWLASNAAQFQRSQSILADIQSSPNRDLAMLSVAIRELRQFS